MAKSSSSASVIVVGGEKKGASVCTASPFRVCRVCTRNEAKYTCPRCNIPYCSVGCYASHGEQCTEAFYREHVRDESALRQAEEDAETGKSAREFIARALLREHDARGDFCVSSTFSASAQGEDDENEDSAEEEALDRLAALDLDNCDNINADALFKIMTQSQRRRFEKEAKV